MSTNIIAPHNVQIAPFELVHMLSLSVEKKINEHAKLVFTGIVSEDLKDSYVEMTDSETQVEVSQKDEEGGLSPLFYGLVQRIEVKAVRDVYVLKVEALSHTCQLDLEKHTRSYQDTGMTYKALIDQMAASYPGMDVLDTATQGASLGKFTLQYQETDWAFLKRMASRFQAGLMPSAMFNSPKVFLGTPDGDAAGKLADMPYSVRKDVLHYRRMCKIGMQGVTEQDFIFYEIETTQWLLDLGQCITFKKQQLYVCEMHSQWKEGMLSHRYLLCSGKGLSQPPLYAAALTGASLQGKVLAIAKDTVQIHLDIDEKQDAGKAYWFPYSSVYTAEGGTGWYCMPEKGDQVRVYFPSGKEENGIASSSVRQNVEEGEHNKLGNPDHKFFRTPAGKELKMTPEEIIITGKDGEVFIRLSDEGGIEIISKKKITIKAEEDIAIDSQQKVLISAKDEISLTCKESLIKMDGNTTIKGKELKTN
ncbi:hypothetical protein BBD42_14295 [Paenibacillus sp. BIHB 4019]|uniref:Gp5/Type VI secretion system Vgr protein OB-fold domain-containing protein n=1 Tax=Paenibacillus sp. BIHB 4019 TaxID=1870819 RepID=A0A1B2DIG7_9BACL|nr:contractile injection system protein, VgrG/Pvc8 family [Paenibacillus sp. BIHB 4019]ANY67512.1 hypothetical protein BBD42_14295 [Paenibacillus sp. BIHB 4019]